MILGSGIRQQIAKMLKDGLSVEQISDSLGIAVEVVAIEAERSTKKNSSENATAREAIRRYQEAAIATLGDLAESAENEGVRAKCAMYLTDVNIGVKEPKVVEKVDNLVQINVLIQAAQQAYTAQLRKVTQESQAEVLNLN